LNFEENNQLMQITGKDILYEDNHIIAVNKKAGMLVQGDHTGDMPLSEAVKVYLKEKYNKPGNVYSGVSHRIDRPVSGVVILAKTSKALSRLNQMFRDKQVQKTYWAVVKNLPQEKSGELIHYLIKDQKKNKSRPVSKHHKKALLSALKYSLIASIDNYHLLEIKPLTGRHHQIRVQLAAAGSPIKGDLKYGFPRSNPDSSISLHARKVEFIHPVKKEPLSIIAPVPEDAVWKAFLEIVG
jgi:23S rRNA pseudouridine1911/1915/1917 synthase